ncbi:unnamed protein product [Rotaria sordida]|uniref:oleoyl-[acyl-carrier-protein] hydrolase n=1 Tax=Rotaria sordida TaxID=392033 RepID=A0A814QQN8_9BILA|nr:unnamed protein product [Rotaria sordida]CAF1263504.1 unnamed protein product [Rotaria sordida]CAF1349951.1 unnamed protein product [Rotaria sordida]CAF3929430.1 unnamed protein product [Rotaria sordida]CAF3953665.1 unnamed protein product [Rotaria sordida]
MASSLNKIHPWFDICHPCPTAKYQVFIFPAAGSPGSCYREWSKHFPEYEFSLIIYPGRSNRMGEKLLTNIKEYIIELNKGLLPYITKPCIFIGHSIGSVINFALARHMIETNNKGYLIKLLVEMGRGPPNLQDPDKSFVYMTDTEIVEELKKIADPKTREVYDFPPFVEMLIPILKADAQIGNELLPSTSLDIPIIVYGGEKEENVKEPFLNTWKELTTKKDLFRVRMFDGHHNFPSECQDQVLKCLKEDFNNIINNSIS